MTCQRCAEEATVHLTESVNGERREMHLCPRCARKAGLGPPKAAPSLGLEGVVQTLITTHVGELVGELAELSCPECGLKFMKARSEGRLGCPADYGVFARGLLPMIAHQHGATRHVGKAPRHTRPFLAADRIRLRARAELRDAITLEDYERAARIRDSLRRNGTGSREG
jgi:protein arginine kinase activator